MYDKDQENIFRIKDQCLVFSRRFSRRGRRKKQMRLVSLGPLANTKVKPSIVLIVEGILKA